MARSVLLIISGSIAAYKSLDLIRRLRERDIVVRAILTKGGEQFITPLAVTSVSSQPTYTELFSPKDEVEMGHIRLSREADIVVVAPASADIIAKMASGIADDLATATLLANNKTLLVAPAMNTQMWNHKATQRNLKQIKEDGAIIIPPGSGELACGEVGAGRMAEPDDILNAILTHLPASENAPLAGVKALVTSGPTFESIDPVRFIGNRSSGKQGHAIAAALARAGATVTLVSGPTAQADPIGVSVKHVTSAEEMLTACEQALPSDVVVCAAAVADWRPSQPSARKLKKAQNGAVPELRLIENPDILAHIAAHPKHRPSLVIGFAAETESALQNATDKRKRKGCDWILANEVGGELGFSSAENKVMLISDAGVESWPLMTKEAIAQKLVTQISQALTVDFEEIPRKGKLQ